MITSTRLFASLCLSLCCYVSISAQTSTKQPAKAGKSSPSVTLSPTATGVRVVAQGTVSHVRLEVYPIAGDETAAPDALASTRFERGNLHDWALVDAQGQPLPDGRYLFVVTARDLDAQLWFKKVTLTVTGGQAAVELMDTSEAAADEQKRTPVAAAPAMTITAHTGAEGRVVSTRGALSFRVGNLFAGRDKEVMRLDEDGTINVSGTLKATKGVEFEDGTVQTSGLSGRKDKDGNVVPFAAGTGTQNRLAKWQETGGAGTLTDAAGAEVNGLVIFGQNASGQVAPLFPQATQFHVLEVGAPGTKTPLVLAGGSASMEFWKDLGGGTGAPAAAGSFGLATPGLGATNDIVFSTYSSGHAWNERMRITNAGNVGIGMPSPTTAKLDVAGTINTQTQYNLGSLRILGVSGEGNFGSSNFFAGVGAGVATTPGSMGDPAGNENSFFGNSAGFQNTTGCRNSFFGDVAGGRNQSGCDNSFFGSLAGRFTQTGSNNTFIGSAADFSTSNPTGDQNTLLGAAAKVNSGVHNGTAIGANALVTQSNSLVLGSINGVNGSTDPSVMVGIGTPAPAYPLTVSGSAGTNQNQGVAEFSSPSSVNDTGLRLNNTAAGGHIYTLFSSGGSSGIGVGNFNIFDATVNASRLSINAAGNVGVGTFDPHAQFQVQGGHIYVGTAGQGIILKSPNGSVCRLLTIDNSGNPLFSPSSCP